LSTGLELSPLGLPLGAGVRQEPERVFGGLHGVFYDSLPDGWGETESCGCLQSNDARHAVGGRRDSRWIPFVSHQVSHQGRW
jgi:hypothetical protein